MISNVTHLITTSHTQACPVAIRRADARAVRHILSARRPTDGARAPIFALQIQATGHDTTRYDTRHSHTSVPLTNVTQHTHKNQPMLHRMTSDPLLERAASTMPLIRPALNTSKASMRTLLILLKHTSSAKDEAGLSTLWLLLPASSRPWRSGLAVGRRPATAAALRSLLLPMGRPISEAKGRGSSRRCVDERGRVINVAAHLGLQATVATRSLLWRRHLHLHLLLLLRLAHHRLLLLLLHLLLAHH